MLIKLNFLLVVLFTCFVGCEKNTGVSKAKPVSSATDPIFFESAYFLEVYSRDYVPSMFKLINYDEEKIVFISDKIRNDIYSDDYWKFLFSLNAKLNLKFELAINDAIKTIAASNDFDEKIKKNPGIIYDFTHLFLLKTKLMKFQNQSMFEYIQFLEELNNEKAIIFGYPLVSQFCLELTHNNKLRVILVDSLEKYMKKYESEDMKLVCRSIIVKLKYEPRYLNYLLEYPEINNNAKYYKWSEDCSKDYKSFFYSLYRDMLVHYEIQDSFQIWSENHFRKKFNNKLDRYGYMRSFK